MSVDGGRHRWSSRDREALEERGLGVRGQMPIGGIDRLGFTRGRAGRLGQGEAAGIPDRRRCRGCTAPPLVLAPSARSARSPRSVDRSDRCPLRQGLRLVRPGTSRPGPYRRERRCLYRSHATVSNAGWALIASGVAAPTGCAPRGRGRRLHSRPWGFRAGKRTDQNRDERQQHQSTRVRISPVLRRTGRCHRPDCRSR